MTHPAFKQKTEEFFLWKGVVQGKSEEYYFVLFDMGLIRTGRAVGCLIDPEIGDQVLAAVTESGESFILSVLVRGSREEAANITIPSNVCLRVTGEFEIQAQQVKAAGVESFTVETSNFNLSTLSGEANFGQLTFRGGLVQGQIEKIKSICQVLEVVAVRMVSRLKRSYREVEEFEESKIGRLRYLIKDLFYLGSKNTVIRAEKRVKVNGDKILLG